MRRRRGLFRRLAGMQLLGYGLRLLEAGSGSRAVTRLPLGDMPKKCGATNKASGNSRGRGRVGRRNAGWGARDTRVGRSCANRLLSPSPRPPSPHPTRLRRRPPGEVEHLGRRRACLSPSGDCRPSGLALALPGSRFVFRQRGVACTSLGGSRQRSVPFPSLDCLPTPPSGTHHFPFPFHCLGRADFGWFLRLGSKFASCWELPRRPEAELPPPSLRGDAPWMCGRRS